MKLISTLLVALLLVAGCATAPTVPGTVSAKDQVILAAGSTIEQIGKTFADTYDLYNALYLARKMPEEQYRKFVSWASDFQVSYALAHQAFKSATTAASASDALDRVLKLKSELLVYYVGAGGKL